MWELFETVRAHEARGVDPLGRTERELQGQIRSAEARLMALRADTVGSPE
jgi:hypothetical protein